jgi:hypothetical protein
MPEKTALWDKLNQPPTWALKSITGGRLKGKTDINPQWRYRALTEELGVCGIGWKYTIEKLWTEPGTNGQVIAFALINLYVNEENGWSEPIPGIGGSMLIEEESKGLHTSDEGYKMAVTDALSVACKMLGVASDIYMGLWDGSKYRNVPNTTSQEPQNQEPQEPEKKYSMIGNATDKQREYIEKRVGKAFDSAREISGFYKFLKTKVAVAKDGDKEVFTKAGASDVLEHFTAYEEEYKAILEQDKEGDDIKL